MPQLLLTTINHHILLAFLALVLLTKCSSSQGSPCQSDSWWDSVNDKCVQCSKCSGQLIAIRPCQLHRDTICGSIHDLKIDMTILSKTEPNWKEVSNQSIYQQIILIDICTSVPYNPYNLLQRFSDFVVQ